MVNLHSADATDRDVEPGMLLRLDALLGHGGDERIALDPASGRNRYGCGVIPEAGVLAFSSSTASAVSPGARAAALACLERVTSYRSEREAYRGELAAVRARLAGACGLAPSLAEKIVVGPSGTDLHLIAADIARGPSLAPLTTVAADPRETGRGVLNAVRSLGYSARSPHGGAVETGRLLAGAVEGAFLGIAVREQDGTARDVEAVDRDAERACARAVRTGGRVLLVVLDVSKTGLIAPSPACAAALKHRYGEAVTVLVDACQFRIGPETLAGYLARGFMVAVTGSKFLGGPCFSGALLLPDQIAEPLRTAALSPALGDYSGRDDWPARYVGRAVLPDLPNLGLLLRWQAALYELEAFSRLPPNDVAAFLRGFAESVYAAMDAAGLEALATQPLATQPLATQPLARAAGDGWDSVQTIFSFLGRRSGELLDDAATQALHRELWRDGVRLGQPVPVGMRDDRPVSVLRLSLSAGQVVEALASPDAAAAARAAADRALALTADRLQAMEPA